jgi:hypothetical protein
MVDLPRETWESVLRELTPEQQRPLLGVNRFLHSLALRSLFHLIHIYLGAFESTHPALNDRGDVSELEAQALERSLAMLAYAAQNSSFGAVVQTMIVHAYAKEEDSNDRVWGKRSLWSTFLITI